MMNLNEVMPAYMEYAKFIPVMDVAREAMFDRSGWTNEDWDAYGDQLAELTMERALGGSDCASMDASRIWKYQAACSALQNYAVKAPRHAEACETVMRMIYP